MIDFALSSSVCILWRDFFPSLTLSMYWSCFWFCSVWFVMCVGFEFHYARLKCFIQDTNTYYFYFYYCLWVSLYAARETVFESIAFTPMASDSTRTRILHTIHSAIGGRMHWFDTVLITMIDRTKVRKSHYWYEASISWFQRLVLPTLSAHCEWMGLLTLQLNDKKTT